MIKSSVNRLSHGSTTEMSSVAQSQAKFAEENDVKTMQRNSATPKMQVWARIRPSPVFDDNVFQVDEGGQRLTVKSNDLHSKKDTFKFPTDGILYNTSQEETFLLVAHDLVDRALKGISVLFLIIGAPMAGKNFTLLGPLGKYDHRGLIPRTIDHLFNAIEEKPTDKLYQIYISAVQVHQNHINDLVTMTPYNIDCVGADGPTQRMKQAVYNRDEAGAILHRFFSDKTGTTTNTYHMFVYIDICVVSINEKAPVQKSRITFTKVASIPNRKHGRKIFVEKKHNYCVDEQGCPCPQPKNTNKKRAPGDFSGVLEGALPFLSDKCQCKNCGPSGIATGLRRDLFFLEQMFVRADALRKLSEIKIKLKRPNLVLKLMQKCHLAPSQYFRQCKLTHCLKDIIKGNTEIRVIIHVRPELEYIEATLDALKFSESVKGITRINQPKKSEYAISGSNSKSSKYQKKLSEDDNDKFGEIIDSEVTIGLNPYQVRILGQQINRYFSEKLEMKDVREKPMKIDRLRDFQKQSKKKLEAIAPSSPSTEKTPSTGKPELGGDLLILNTVVNFIDNKESQLPPEVKTAETAAAVAGEVVIGEKKDNEDLAELIYKQDLTDDSNTNNNNNTGSNNSKRGRKGSLKERQRRDSAPSSGKSQRKKRDGSEVPTKEKKSSRKKKKNHARESTATLDADEQVEETEDVIEEDAPPTCQQVWYSFVQSEGQLCTAEVTSKLNFMNRFMREHTNIFKYTENLQEKIQRLKMEVAGFKKSSRRSKSNPISEEEKLLRYEMKVLQLSRDPLLVRLRNMIKRLEFLENSLKSSRTICQTEFQMFSIVNFGMMFPASEIPLNSPEYQFDPSIILENKQTPPEGKDLLNSGEYPQWGISSEFKSPQTNARFSMGSRRTKSLPNRFVDSVSSKNYKQVSHIGHAQARILKKLNRLKPQWIKYY